MQTIGALFTCLVLFSFVYLTYKAVVGTFKGVHKVTKEATKTALRKAGKAIQEGMKDAE